MGELTRRDFLRRASAALGSVAAANLLLAACNNNPNPTAPPVVEEAAQPTQAPATEAAAAGSETDLNNEMVEYQDADGETLIYEGAGHAFFNDTAPSYNAEAAQDAWPRTLDWFRKHLSA